MSKSTLSASGGRWFSLDLIILSFQQIASMEEKDLVLQQQQRALGMHTVHFFHQSPFLTSWFSCLSTQLVNERTFTYITDMSHARLNVHAWSVTVAKS